MQVYSNILMDKMEKQREREKAALDKQDKKKPVETKAEVTRKSTRSGGPQAEEPAPSKKMPSRTKAKKAAGGGIASYFKNEDLRASSKA